MYDCFINSDSKEFQSIPCANRLSVSFKNHVFHQRNGEISGIVFKLLQVRHGHVENTACQGTKEGSPPANVLEKKKSQHSWDEGTLHSDGIPNVYVQLLLKDSSGHHRGDF